MQTFQELPGLLATSTIAAALDADGITTPTPIQAQGFAPILAGRNVVLHSGTGTGKTLAYLLPVLQRLAAGQSKRAVVLAPTPELALQILRVANRYKSGEITSSSAVPSGNYSQQKSRIQKSTRLIVGTPGRILEMYSARRLKNVDTMVLDEPDHTLTSAHADFLREVISRPEPRLRVVIVGATIGPPTQALIDSLENVARVEPKALDEHDHLQHLVVHLKAGQAKDVRVARFLEANRCERAFLFVNQDKHVGHLFRYLSDHGHKPVTLGLDRTKAERKKAMVAFADGRAKVLITSDAGARGLDVADVPWVLHYDVPHSAPVYLHRAGRTARAGNAGTSVSFCSPDERPRLAAIARELGIRISVGSYDVGSGT